MRSDIYEIEDETESMMFLDFIKLVKTMRETQKEYFCVKAPSVLARAKKHEKAVDGFIYAWERKDEPKQRKLFQTRRQSQ